MASYTDIAPKFTPYIQQLPVEAMVQVGMEKQRRYDEGVQKIQTNIDNVAGLDVIRDVDKQYLQSKLNELGSKLKTVAAGDFSNYQLVNSVGGMATQIGRDSTIQNAVGSTAKYRKELANREVLKKEGKGAIQNDWDFSNKANDWLNSDDINKSFNESYTPYVDVQKKWFDVLKGLHSDLREEDIPYEKNDDGSINYNKTAAAMQRVSRESVSSDKIENALRSSLTPDELNQLSIDGRYTFRGYDTPEKLSAYATSKYNSTIANTDKVIEKLNGLANMATSDPTVREQALKSIESLNQNKIKLKEQLNNEIRDIIEDPNAAKARIYKNGAITQFAEANSWEHNKATLLSNPVLETEHWNKNFALDQSKFNLSQRAQSFAEFKGRFDMDMANKDYQLKVQKQQMELYGNTSAPFEVYGGQSTNVKAPLDAMELDAIDLDKSANLKIGEMARGIGVSPGQLEAAIADYNSGDATRIGRAKNIIPVDYRGMADEIVNDQLEAKRIKLAIDKTKSDVLNSPEFIQKENQFIKDLSKLNPITVKTSSGNRVTFTPKEVSEFLEKESQLKPSTFGEEQDWRSIEKYSKPLSIKEKLIADAIKKGYVSKTDIKSYRDLNDRKSSFTSSINQKVNAELLKKSGEYIPRLTTITFGSGEGNIARRTWEGIASSLLSKYDQEITGMKGGADKLTQDDIATAREWLSGKDKDDIIYKKLTQGTKGYLVLLKGGEEKMIPMEQRELNQLPITDPNEPTPAYKKLYSTQNMFNGNTNPTGKFEDAYFNRPYIPNVKNLDVKADIRWDKSNSAQQYITIRLKTPNRTMDLSLDDNPTSREQAVGFIQNLNDAKVKQLFMNDSRIPDSWKMEIKDL